MFSLVNRSSLLLHHLLVQVMLRRDLLQQNKQGGRKSFSLAIQAQLYDQLAAYKSIAQAAGATQYAAVATGIAGDGCHNMSTFGVARFQGTASGLGNGMLNMPIQAQSIRGPFKPE